MANMDLVHGPFDLVEAIRFLAGRVVELDAKIQLLQQQAQVASNGSARKRRERINEQAKDQ